MSSPGFVFGTIGFAMVLFAAGMWKGTATTSLFPAVTHDWSTTAVSSPDAAPWPPDEAVRERLVDRYGNELHRAVGEYRIDYRGDVYERHSPNTALPRLAPPEA